jgi:hypothetical protein
MNVFKQTAVEAENIWKKANNKKIIREKNVAGQIKYQYRNNLADLEQC